MPLGFCEHEASRISRQSAHEGVVSHTPRMVQFIPIRSVGVGGGWSASSFDRFTLGRIPYLFCWRLTGSLDRPGRHRKSR
jgi:hypothetical protein